MSASVPRVVVVSRASQYEQLLERHGTRAQVEFFAKTHGLSLRDLDARHSRQLAALQQASAAIPVAWRRARVDRRDLGRFVFGPEDIVLAVGQDGLVANVAKYLTGQSVIGINADPSSYDGALVRSSARDARELLLSTHAGRTRLESRTMVAVSTDDGQQLVALNEVFLGHRTHQSARYRIRFGEQDEMQSSSGAIVSTGTGATGWARSIHRERAHAPRLPAPCERQLAFFVREAFPSVSTRTELTAGLIGPNECLEITSEMSDGGVLFGDGIEEDRIDFSWGIRARVRVAEQNLALVS